MTVPPLPTVPDQVDGGAASVSLAQETESDGSPRPARVAAAAILVLVTATGLAVTARPALRRRFPGR